MSETITLEVVLELATRLTVVDKIRLIERVVTQIEQEVSRPEQQPRTSLRGAWRGLDVTDEDIAAVRHEMWLSEWQSLGQRIEAESVDPRSCVDILLDDRG